MHGNELFAQAFVYLAAAIIAVPLMKRLGLGSVLGYLIAGLAIGPYGLNLVGSEADVMHFAEFGVVMMLFIVGLELNLAKLWRLRGPILGLGGMQVLVTNALIALVLVAMGIPWQTGVILGSVFALSSTAIVLQIMNEKGLLNQEEGQSGFSVLLFQDIAVIPMLALFPLLATGTTGQTDTAHATAISDLSGWLQTLIIVAAVAGIVAAGRFLARPLFELLIETRMRELFTACALAIVIGITLVMQQLGLSPALGTFVAGVVLASNEYRHELEATMDPFKSLLLGLFFISIGAGLNVSMVIDQPLSLAGAVVTVMLGKAIVLYILAMKGRLMPSARWTFSILLCQAGEFGFVLLAFASSQGLLSDPTYAEFATTVIAASMFLTPFLIIVNDRFIQPRYATGQQEDRRDEPPPQPGEVIIAGYGRFGQIVARLLNLQGIKTTLLDLSPRQIDLVRKFGTTVFYGDASRPDLLEAAGAKTAKLIVIAIDQHHKTMEMVTMIQRHFLQATILARARGRREAFELMAAGVKHVHRETFGSALDMGVKALRLSGLRAHQAYRFGQIFERHDEQSLRDMYKEFVQEGETAEYIAKARRRADDICKVLQVDRDDPVVHEDHTWESAPRRGEGNPA